MMTRRPFEYRLNDEYMARVHAIAARVAAGPVEIFLTPIGQEPVFHQAPTLDELFAVWEQTSKRFIWREDDIGRSAEIIAMTVFTSVGIYPESLTELQPVSPGSVDGYIYRVRFEEDGEEMYLPIWNSIGCFWATSPNDSKQRYFCFYIGDAKVASASGCPMSLNQHFQNIYSTIVGHGEYLGAAVWTLFQGRYHQHKPKLFRTLANRSINRRRKISSRTRARILDRDKSTCQICGRRAPDVELEVDHHVPVVEGGGNDDDNLWTICRDCNRGKSDLPLFLY